MLLHIAARRDDEVLVTRKQGTIGRPELGDNLRGVVLALDCVGNPAPAFADGQRGAPSFTGGDVQVSSQDVPAVSVFLDAPCFTNGRRFNWIDRKLQFDQARCTRLVRSPIIHIVDTVTNQLTDTATGLSKAPTTVAPSPCVDNILGAEAVARCFPITAASTAEPSKPLLCVLVD